MRINRWIALLAGIVALLSLAACGGGQTAPTAVPASQAAQTDRSDPAPDKPESKTETETNAEDTMRFFINDTEVAVAWEENASVTALTELAKAAPLRIDMSMYGGFEQVGALGTELPRNDRQTTTQAGDLVLYAGDQLVVFYGSNAWAYTRLGRITDKTAAELADLLGNGSVTITITNGG